MSTRSTGIIFFVLSVTKADFRSMSAFKSPSTAWIKTVSSTFVFAAKQSGLITNGAMLILPFVCVCVCVFALVFR